jgi:hypothetical protein
MKFIKYEESHQGFRLEKTALEKSVDYKGFVIPLLLYYLIHVSRERYSLIYIHYFYFNYIYQTIQNFTANYPADLHFAHSVKTY